MVHDIKMYRTTSETRNPRPSYGRVGGIYDPQGSTRYGRLGPLTGGLSHQNSYMEAEDGLTKGGHPESALVRLIAGMGMVMTSPPQAEGQTIRGSAPSE